MAGIIKCNGIINGKECGRILSINVKFCSECGAENKGTEFIDCSCGVTLRASQKFCHSCGCKVNKDHVIFHEPQVCSAKNKDGILCGYSLIPGLPFCPKCGAPVTSVENEQINKDSVLTLCTGKRKDGKLCKFQLQPGCEFCPKCGTPVQIETSHPLSSISTGGGQDNENNAPDLSANVNPDSHVGNAEECKPSELVNTNLLEEDITVYEKEFPLLEAPKQYFAQYASFTYNVQKEGTCGQEQITRNNSENPMLYTTLEKGRRKDDMESTTLNHKQYIPSNTEEGFSPSFKEEEEVNGIEGKNKNSVHHSTRREEEGISSGQLNTSTSISGVLEIECEHLSESSRLSSELKKNNEGKDEDHPDDTCTGAGDASSRSIEEKGPMIDLPLPVQVSDELQQAEKYLTSEESQQGEEHLSTEESINNEKDQASGVSKNTGKGKIKDKSKNTEKFEPNKESKKAKRNKGNKKSKKAEKDKFSEESKKAEKDKPSEESKKAEKDKPSEESKKAEKNKPSEESKKAEKNKPSEESKKAETDKPSEESKKAEKNKPSEESKKAEKDKPSEESKKAEKNKPSEESKKGGQSQSGEKSKKKGIGQENSDLKTDEEQKKQEKQVKIGKGPNLTGTSEPNSTTLLKNNAAGRSDFEMVTVVFHVIMSGEFELDPEKDLVFIRCEPASLGTFQPNEDRHRLEFQRSTTVGLLFEGKVVMGRQLRNKGFQYKYLVHKNDMKNITWEIVQRKSRGEKSEVVNRDFSMPEMSKLQTGEWHRYDGVSYPKSFKDGFWNRNAPGIVKDFLGLKSLVDRVREEAVLSGKEFLPSVRDVKNIILNPTFSEKLMAEDLLLKIRNVMSSLKFQMLDTDLELVDNQLVKRCVNDNLILPLLKFIEEMLAENAQHGIVTIAIFVLMVIFEFEIFIEYKFINIMCRALLLIPDTQNKVCPDLTDIEKHFPRMMKDKKNLAKFLLKLIDKSDNDRTYLPDPRWLCCVPLVHFMESKSVPFCDLEITPNYRSDEWWGITSFMRRKHTFQAATSHIPLSKDFIELIKPVLAADQLLVRTIVASLNFDPLLSFLLDGHVPIEVTAATLSHHVGMRTYYLPNHKKDLEDVMEKMVQTLKERSTDEAKSDLQRKYNCQAILIAELHSEVFQRSRDFTEAFILNLTHAMFLAIDRLVVEKWKAFKDNEGALPEQCLRLARDTTKVSCNWIAQTFFLSRYNMKNLQKHLQMWGHLLRGTESLVCKALKQELERIVADQFEVELNKTTADVKLEVFLNQEDQVVPAFVGILNRLAFESLEAAFKMKSERLYDQDIRLLSLLSNFLEKTWKENVLKEDDVLTFVITWHPMINYLQRFRDQKSMENMTVLAKSNIKLALEKIDHLLQDITSGKVQIKFLLFLMAHLEQFYAVMVAAGFGRGVVEHLVTLRMHELKAFETASNHLDRLFEHCHKFLQTADVQDVKECIEHFQRCSENNYVLSSVCDIALPESIDNLNDYKPTANPWGLDDDILATLPDVDKKMTSHIFNTIFARMASKLQMADLEFWKAFQFLWKEVNKEWDVLCTKLTDGTIAINEIEKLFQLFLTEEGNYNYGEITGELRKVAGDGANDWVDERISQFSCYADIKKHVKAAAVLIEVRQAYDIGGNFGDIETVCSLSQNRTKPIRDLDKSVLRLCKHLEDVTPQDIHCLKEFTKPQCKMFVQWLRATMKEGLKELNVFVDLAFISAGEEPMAIGRVNCFHSAATGYAPLIFTDIKDCNHLLDQCRLVFKNVTADPQLPQKLMDTGRFLDWFKDVQKAHGSVEKTSLSQVGNINARGVFKIGNADKKGLNLQKVIHLDVSEDNEGKTPPRTYTYDELLDLQSRLMLVAGQAEKGKENVDRFMIIMDSLVRLGKTYIQICGDGCILFLKWSVNFLCDQTRPLCCSSQFSGQGMLKGHHRPKEELEQFIAAVAAFLEKCHVEWLEYVDKKRRDYPELNMFTVEQLVFLQQQLVRVGSENISKFVYPLLSLLKAECTPQHLEAAIQTALDEVNSIDQELKKQQQQEMQMQRQRERSNKEMVSLFLKKMKVNGFRKSLALKAMAEVGCENVSKGIAWCIVQDELDDDEDDKEEDMDTEDSESESENEYEEEVVPVGQRLKEWFTRDEPIAQKAVEWLQEAGRRDETSLRSLIGNLSFVWKKFIETVSTSGSDFLSLEHLGIILKHLANMDTREFQRRLPPDFKPGSPNLIICPKNEVLNTVTYMYMFPEELSAPLPQPDEVLLCTEETSFEKVDIFLRRAIFGKQQKVHCLAFADYLDYDVGEKVEKKITEYLSHSDVIFQLVVVCTTENEYRARIVAALEKHQRPTPALSSANKSRQFLRTKFTELVNKTERKSASSLDPENSCVRLVKSTRSGVGKTLYKQRLASQLKKMYPDEKRQLSITIALHCRVVHVQDIAASLLEHTLDPDVLLPRIIHLDISYEVQEGVDHLLYNLLVLGCVTDRRGRVWLRSPADLYLVETLPLLDQKDQQRGKLLVHQIFDVLPGLNCWSPQDSLMIMKEPTKMTGYQKHDRLFDDEEFESEAFQRPYQYLQRLDTNQQPQAYQYGQPVGRKNECLELLLKYCGVQNPSWSELQHFVCFLNKQLQDFEHSVYCSMALSHDLPGFSVFVLRFLIQMSRDFATRSLKISEESLSALTGADVNDTDIELYEMRRTWESSPHPYIFFNPDEHSMTFLGFSIDHKSGNLLDNQSGKVLVQAIMSVQLFQCLIVNRVPLTENFDILPREDRLMRLYRVLGLRDEEIFVKGRIVDPDETYELTTDNVKKILAIYMRFRCNIPVIVMGETGCGKTRLVKFLCALQSPQDKGIDTMVLVKVHGGTTGKDIIKKVHEAEKKAKKNAEAFPYRPVYTVLFFDEANTTEAVGVIKEIMCDGTMNGEPISLSESLKMVAACNPYRKHSDDLIKRLENAGLGYHVDAEKTTDRLGRVPMRRLVYRVQPLPQSMLPLVWDFGQLDTRVEKLYIMQMIKRYVRYGQLGSLDESGIDVLCKILMESQQFMRKQEDECSFVSLRDVDRALTVMSWFMIQACHDRTLFRLLDNKLNPKEVDDGLLDESQDSWSTADEETDDDEESDMTTAVILSLAVCYRACLRSKSDYDKHIVQHFRPPFILNDGKQQFLNIIDKCQEVFLDSVRLEENIARNQALKENVFMMVVCIELRIPLFLVGKPGSSKSLAKTIVGDAMQGTSSYSDIFKKLKQAQMVSFQCSPLATADGILGTFRQCAQFQKGKSKDTFVSVVVLDEVGLAEDSPKMPLKTLHPLLEDGCPGDEMPEDCKKVAFIGISNWALDPAKMNRGILVQREVPDENELEETAMGICTTKNRIALQNVQPLIPKLAKAYLGIFEEAKLKREFFGLRDFYSLVKMVYGFAARSGKRPSHSQLIAAIKRNFGGLDTIDPVKCFQRLIPSGFSLEEPRPDDPDCTAAGLVRAALRGDDMGGENRYLLLLTENYGGLSILSENLLADRRVVPIFGSSFPKDQEYTQICCNINRIKVCMETGLTVILLNLENLYESLYDALNQYYAMLGGERYVDLGLGTHRVKCRVHRQFRLIVVAEKQAVYDKFPIPLINRLEKHFLTLNNIMTAEQLAMAQELEKWAKNFVKSVPVTRNMKRAGKKEETVGDVFMGFHPDTAPAVILKSWDMLQVDKNYEAKAQVLEESKKILLLCATPDAVVRTREDYWIRIYNEEQQHEHLAQYLQYHLTQYPDTMLMAQVTTHSKLLTEHERNDLSEILPVKNITLLSLQAFDTEQQFRKQLIAFFDTKQKDGKLLLVQCDCGDVNQNLIKCAQYCMQDLRPAHTSNHHVVFIIQLPRVAGACFTGFLGGGWYCLHIDDLRAPDRPVPPIIQLQSHTPATLLMAASTVWDNEDRDNQNNSSDHLPWQGPLTEIMDLDVEDIQVQLPLEMNIGPLQVPLPQSEWQQAQGFDPAYIQHMLTSCIQAAVALVHDENTDSLRATHRISILLQMMECKKNVADNKFFKGIVHMVGSILKEREQKAYEAERWLSKEAAKLDTVKKAGTFRRAWMKCLEDKITPVLARVIAYLDTNNNLDLVCTDNNRDMTPDWIPKLWLDIVQHPDIFRLTYAHLLSMSGREELDEFTVQRTSAGDSPFSARLPFSWLVYELVEGATSELRGNEDNLVDTAGNVVELSALGQCLQAAVSSSENDMKQLFQAYIADLLHFKFTVNQEEHQLLCECVEKGLRQLNVDLLQLGVCHGLVVLHSRLDKMKGRLQAILDMIVCQPDSIRLLRTCAGPAAPLLSSQDEMTEDVALLTLLVEHLKPEESQFSDRNGCEEWVGRYSSIAPFIMRILSDAEVISTEMSSIQQEEQEEQIEDVSQKSELFPFGDRCKQQLTIIRCLWTRMVTVKLFFDFVSPLRNGPAKTSKALEGVTYQLLWTLLEDDCNMKRVNTLQRVDKFLKHANGHMMKVLIGKVGRCTYCSKKLESAPVRLPCEHSLCNSCFRDFCPGTQIGKCPECEYPVPQNFDPTPKDSEYRDAVEQLGQYQRQISGFLMALVSQLCFIGQEPPEPAAIKHIFGYVTHRSKEKPLLQTKQMTVVDDLIDPTPVLRSFLLRLLLKHSAAEVRMHLDEFLEHGRKIVEQRLPASIELQGTPTLIELCLLIIHCIEDLQYEVEATGRDDLEHLQNEDRHLVLADMLHDLRRTMQAPAMELTTLFSLGRLRYALASCAHILHMTFVEPQGAQEMTEDLKDLLIEVMRFCQYTETDMPKKFLIKQLCREYGVHAYMALAKIAKRDKMLQWIILKETATKMQEVPDRYLLCGENYKAIRDGLKQLRLSADSKELMQLLQDLQLPKDQLEMLVLLALHRDVTMSFLQPVREELQAERERQMAVVKEFIESCDFLQEKVVAQQLCENTLGMVGSPLCIKPGQDVGTQSLTCILTHIYLALHLGNHASHLLHPLHTLVTQPVNMANAFLPTMPQDNIDEIIEAVEKNPSWGAPKVWRCPKGHRYLIGDCGRPVLNATCNICGSQIGGTGYNQPIAGNLLDIGADETQTGHILGAAGQRGKDALPERQLSAAECALTRFFTHAVLYLGAMNPAQTDQLAQMVQPRIPSQNACQYYWEHLQHDIQILQQVLGCNSDDVYLALHFICQQMATKKSDGERVLLTSKQQRASWEKEFATMFLSPMIQNIQRILEKENKIIVSDKRQGESELLNVIYEIGDQIAQRECSLQHLQRFPVLWRYRPRITVDHFFRQFHLQVESQQGERNKYPVIRLFKAESHILRALYYVPAILASQRQLMQRLYRRLDRADAATLIIQDVMKKKDFAGLGFLLKNFCKAWDIVKENLIAYRCMTRTEGLVSIPVEFHNASITSNSPLAVLLPSTHGPGLCAYVLLHFLLGRHNDFLNRYCSLVKQSFKSLPEISVRSINKRHLVGYSPEKDVLPMVLAHCNYSLMVGQATTLEYDFAAFQQQLQDTMFLCKSRVQREQDGYMNLETMIYKADTTSSRLFKVLRDKISQESLSPAERRQIAEDLRDKLPEICQSIDNLNTALSFLKALGGVPDSSLHEFMAQGLKMKKTIHSRKAQQICCLKHVQSLWIFLCHQRAMILANHDQDAFDSHEKQLHVEMSKEEGRELEVMCHQLSIERLELLLLQMFECIMLRLSEPPEQDEDTLPENLNLRDVLVAHLEIPVYITEPVEFRSGLLIPADLNSFPESLRGCHAIHSWLACYKHLLNKRQQFQ